LSDSKQGVGQEGGTDSAGNKHLGEGRDKAPERLKGVEKGPSVSDGRAVDPALPNKEWNKRRVLQSKRRVGNVLKGYPLKLFSATEKFHCPAQIFLHDWLKLGIDETPVGETCIGDCEGQQQKLNQDPNSGYGAFHSYTHAMTLTDMTTPKLELTLKRMPRFSATYASQFQVSVFVATH
jgi:hypothetical protein